MATFIGIGFSKHSNIEQAAELASQEALKHIPKHSTINLCLVFATPDYSDQNTVNAIHRVLNPEHLVGCSSAGVILAKSIQMQGISVVAIASDEIKFGVGKINDLIKTPLREAGASLARNCLKNYNENRRNSFLFFTDGYFHNNTLFSKGIQEVLGNGFSMVGAICSDKFEYQNTFQFCQKDFLANGASGLIIGGSASLYLGNKHGWQPLGKPHFIDYAEGHTIHTIDGKPAVEIYKHYFGANANELLASKNSPMSILYPLGIYNEEERDYILRNPIDVLDNGSIVCQGDVPIGAEVHLMISNKESCRASAQQAAQEVKQNLFGKQAKLIIIIESLTRYKLLGRSALQELEVIREELGYTTPIVGMYSYGEISPFRSLQKVKKPYVHNENIVILALG